MTTDVPNLTPDVSFGTSETSDPHQTSPTRGKDKALNRSDLERAEEWAWSCAEAYSEALRKERALADELAKAIASHGPWMDDQCRDALAKWEVARGVRKS